MRRASSEGGQPGYKLVCMLRCIHRLETYDAKEMPSVIHYFGSWVMFIIIFLLNRQIICCLEHCLHIAFTFIGTSGKTQGDTL